MVASYCSASRLNRGDTAPLTRSAALWKLPARSNQVWSLNVSDSMTSVSSSQRPSECPMNVSIGGASTSVMWMDRVAPTYSEAIRMNSGALDDLERERHVHDARDARQVALDLGIGRQPLLGVRLLLLGGRPGLVGNLAALHHRLARRHRPDRAQRHHGPRRARNGPREVPSGPCRWPARCRFRSGRPSPVRDGCVCPSAATGVSTHTSSPARTPPASSSITRPISLPIGQFLLRAPRLPVQATRAPAAALVAPGIQRGRRHANISCRPGATSESTSGTLRAANPTPASSSSHRSRGNSPSTWRSPDRLARSRRRSRSRKA